MTRIVLALLLTVCGVPLTYGADVPGSKDPPDMKRYAGSEIIGYRAPKFDEYVLPLGLTTSYSPAKYEKSQPIEGQLSRYAYAAPAGRTPAELIRNYRTEIDRLGLELLYEKRVGERGWFGPTFDKFAEEDGLGQILAYNEAEERMLVARSKGANPSYYVVFVTSYRDGIIPERLKTTVEKGRALALVVLVAADRVEQKMVFVNADEMKKSLTEQGRVALYGIYFDSDKDAVKPESAPTIQEIVRLLAANPTLRLHVVGHTDNQGQPEYNLDLSRRRAANVVRELTSRGAAAQRLDSFGAGLYAPTAANDTDEGRARNRRVELVAW